jgi:hypothetical protein
MRRRDDRVVPPGGQPMDQSPPLGEQLRALPVAGW